MILLQLVLQKSYQPLIPTNDINFNTNYNISLYNKSWYYNMVQNCERFNFFHFHLYEVTSCLVEMLLQRCFKISQQTSKVELGCYFWMHPVIYFFADSKRHRVAGTDSVYPPKTSCCVWFAPWITFPDCPDCTARQCGGYVFMVWLALLSNILSDN